jgi:glycosyltransferase involved in cell wall biosynthesis
VVLPSEWYENAPMSVLEAYASGKPVIGARIGGIPEMVKPGETGLLFGSGASTELAECLCKLADAPDATVAAMGEVARHYVVETFNAERYGRDMLSLYADLGVRMGDGEATRLAGAGVHIA